MTAAETDKCAQIIADEIVKLINLFGQILHEASETGNVSNGEKHHAAR